MDIKDTYRTIKDTTTPPHGWSSIFGGSTFTIDTFIYTTS